MFIFRVKDEHGSFLHEIIADDIEQAYQMAYEEYPDYEIECIDIIGDENY